MQRKTEAIHKSSSQNLRKFGRLAEEELKKQRERDSPLMRLLVNSPKGHTKMEPTGFGKHHITRTLLSKDQRKKPNRPTSGLRMDHSSNSKHQRPSSVKDKSDTQELRKKPTNQSSSTDLKSKKKQALATTEPVHEQETTEYRRLQEKLSYLEGKIMAIKSNLGKKVQLKKSETEKVIGMLPKSELKKQKRDLSKKENTDANLLSKFVTQVHSNHSHNIIKRDPYALNGIYYVSEISRCFQEHGLPLARDHIVQCLQTMKFMREVDKPSLREIEPKKVNLPKREQYRNKKTVILDLDETLIHCNESLQIPHDVELEIKFATGERIDAGINVRPFATELLKALSQKFEVIVFTASHPCYANVVMDYLDPGSKYVSHRLYRQNCWQTEPGAYVKDLRVIANRNFSDMVLVDNAAYSYFFQLQNGIPIIPYYEGKNDYELKHLLGYLLQLENCKDVRELNRRYFKLEKYLAYNTAEELVKELYGEWLTEKVNRPPLE